MRRTLLAARGAKGHGWYQKFMRDGEKGFQRNRPPTPFDWDKGNVTRPKAYLDFVSNEEKLGRLVFELAEDVLPRTVQNFLALCEEKTEKKRFSYQVKHYLFCQYFSPLSNFRPLVTTFGSLLMTLHFVLHRVPEFITS